MANWFAKLQKDFVLNFVDDNRWKYLTSGLANTLKITFFAVLIGIALGVVIAIVRSTWDKNQETMRPGLPKFLLRLGNAICQIYLTVIRGTPVLVQLMIIYYIIFASSNNGVLIATLAFGINSGAYVAWYIIIPQALKSVLPALANEFIVLLKETSVAGYVAIRDLTKGGDIIRGVTYSPFLPLIAVALIYLVMVMFFTWLVGRLERRLRSSDH